MLLLIASLAASTASPPDSSRSRPAGATAHATATIRVLSGADISWSTPAAGLPRLRAAQWRNPRGELEPVRLIEFE